MDTWTIEELRAIVNALRVHLEAMPPGNAWAIKTLSGELRWWLAKERELAGKPAAPAHSQQGIADGAR